MINYYEDQDINFSSEEDFEDTNCNSIVANAYTFNRILEAQEVGLPKIYVRQQIHVVYQYMCKLKRVSPYQVSYHD